MFYRLYRYLVHALLKGGQHQPNLRNQYLDIYRTSYWQMSKNQSRRSFTAQLSSSNIARSDTEAQLIMFRAEAGAAGSSSTPSECLRPTLRHKIPSKTVTFASSPTTAVYEVPRWEKRTLDWAECMARSKELRAQVKQHRLGHFERLGELKFLQVVEGAQIHVWKSQICPYCSSLRRDRLKLRDVLRQNGLAHQVKPSRVLPKFVCTCPGVPTDRDIPLHRLVFGFNRSMSG